VRREGGGGDCRNAVTYVSMEVEVHPATSYITYIASSKDGAMKVRSSAHSREVGKVEWR